jgi:hypothetical protein
LKISPKFTTNPQFSQHQNTPTLSQYSTFILTFTLLQNILCLLQYVNRIPTFSHCFRYVSLSKKFINCTNTYTHQNSSFQKSVDNNKHH